jgi:excisionase family DNA binding protein
MCAFPLEAFFVPAIPQSTEPRRYASLAKAAEYADCNERTLRRHIATGELTGYRLGRNIRIDLNELDVWLAPIPSVKAG